MMELFPWIVLLWCLGGLVGDVGCAPQFVDPNPSASITLSENTAIGTTVYDVTVTDDDFPVTNGDFTYSIAGDQGLFAVTKKSNYEQAAVTVIGNIDYETYTTFTLTITATNSFSSAIFPVINVNVQDENEAPTLNLNNVVTMAENSAVGTAVFTVLCSDVDTTSPHSDTVLTHNDVDGSGFFDIAGTGAVTLSSSADLDYETRQQHTLTFTCTDGGTPALSATGTLDIQVTNVNEAPVITSPSSGSQIEAIDENTNPNTNVFQFVAGDDDSGDTQTWSIFSQTPNAQFVINSASGQVSTSSSTSLDYETNNQYILVVHVVDSTSLTASATLTVNLNDVNEAPTFTLYPASDTVSVSEDQSGSFTIFTFTASDVEISTQTLTFSMVLDNTSPTTTTAIPFEFVKTSATQAILRTAAAPTIDFETVSQYDVTLTVSDDAGLSLSEDRALSIYIQDVNEAPVISNTAASLIMSLDENQAGGAAVFTFTGSDEDQPGDTLTWTMASQNPSSQFVIDAASGIVSTSASPTINYESAETQYLLTVELDDGTLTAAATLTVNVNDINEAPTMNLNDVVTMAENSAVGTSVFDVICSDDDTTSPQSDTVLTHADVDGSGFFDVASTGAVTLSSTADLNYENSQQHTLTFTCTDGGTTALSSTGTLNIQVTNVNEAPVITTPSSGSQIEAIDENTNPNTNVFQFVASDDDSGDTQTWSIFSQTPNAQFVINSASGQVSTSSSPVLDYETNNQYILVVHVVDSTSLTASATLTVNLNDVNEAPAFTVYPASDTVNVDENESGSVTIDTFTASDPEIGTQTLTFSMTLDSTIPPGGVTIPFEFVKTSATQAILRTAAAPTIDFETISQYDVTLTVSDGAGLSEDRSLSIYINDLNEAPVINNTAASLTMSLDENQAANVAVFTFTGSDEDLPGDTLTWTMTNQNPSSQFVINSATGVVSTVTSPTINFESTETQYLLTVQLDDTALTATATLTVNVIDVNETPDFTNFPGSASVDVNEDTAGGVTVQSFTVYDDDNALVSTTQDITYTIAIVTPVGETLPFTFDKVNNTNVNLNTDSTATIDYENLWSTHGTNQYEVTLTVSDGALSSVRTFYINILDVNESPVITNLASSLSTTIDEDQSGGKNLIYFTGTDVDLPGDTLTWSIASQTPNALGTNFEIGPSTGVLSLVSSPNLDYETETQYLLQIELNDGTGTGRLTATVTYTVNIRDINEAPIFSDTSLTYEIDENTVGGVTICPTSNTACTTTLQGADPDGDTLTYTLISYSPVEDGYSNPFQLTPSGNDLVIETVASPELDYERTTAYTLKIRVTDGSTSGSMSSTGEITINLVDLDETPEWRNLPNSVTVSEDLAGNQKVYTVDAVDSEGVSVTYALTTATTAFTLVTGTGEIRTTANPQLESGAFLYTLEIEAADATTNTATSTLTVNVAFYDDSPPVFSPTTYAVNVNEGQSSGTTVTTIAATDADVGDVVQYYITGGSGYFLVDSAGVITTGTELDRDDGSPSSYTLTLTAYDTSGLSAQANVTVTVDAVNDNAPVFSQAVDSVNVPENTAVTTSVLQLTCADADTGTDGDLVYTLDSGNTDNLFALDTSTGLITVNSAIDLESAAIISSNFKYTLKVTAVDQAAVATDRFTSTATIYVTITGQNEFTPDFTTMPASDTVTLSEDIAVATTVTSNVAATDGDQGSQGDIVYAITGGDTSSPRTFTMNPANGRIVLAQPLDFETTPVYYLELSAIDDASSPLTGTATLTVSVTDVDDASPAFSTDTYEATVGEDQTANAYVVQLTVTDADTAGADMTYSFIAGNTAGNFWLFTLNNTENNPWVMLSNQLDYDTGDDVFTLVVKAQDQSSNTATAQVLIYVDHVNEFQPVWGSPSALPSDSVTVDEDQPIGTTVLTLDVSDSDAGTDGDLTYTITAGNTNSIFELDPKTGELLVSKGLDFETSGGTYNLSIQAVDGGNPARSADSYVLVTIGNVNDNPPSCTQTTYVVQVPEDQTVNLIPGFVNMDCDDGDGDILTDSIISGDPAGTFRITQNGAFFTIYLGSALDYDDPNSTPRSYDLIVQLSDGTTTLEVPVVIGVTPVNEGPPTITDNTVTVSENTPIGDVIYDVDDSDPDADDQAHGIVTYAITGPATHPFRIDSSTGEISVASTLDYETSFSYNLVVVATDGGGLASTATVTVNLDGVNEFYPTCTSSDFGVAVSENANTGNVVVDLGCTDSDSGFDGALTYTATQTPSTKFDVSTGQIQVSSTLDYDGGETLYSLVVLVSDNSVIPANQKTTTVTVTIEVSPENVAPAFSSTIFTETVSEDTNIGSTVIDLDATDADASSHAHGIVTYSITSGNTDGHFSIDPSSGVIVTTSPLDWETTPLYSLEVEAVDGGTPPLSSTTLIAIIIDDVNDNTAQCVPSVFSETVSESEAADYIVTSLSCTDSDGTFGVLTYSITAGDTNQFYMNGSDLLLTTPLDYDAVPRQYNLEITVADNGSPPNYDVIPVTVHVDPVNEFPPVFVLSGDVVLSVDEDFTVNDPITNVAATDADSDVNAHGQITYTILSGNINAKFSLDSATGILYLVDELDRETTASYNILVQASDGVLFNAGTPNTITKWVNITVNDINDNEPQCTPSNYAVTFNESTATGTVMTTVTCQDLFDAGTNAQIQYFFSGSGNVGNTFAIDQTTGQITLQNPLEYDSSSDPQSYSLTVHAIDQGTTKLTGTALVTVAVSPVNEDTPQFSETAYVVSVPEDTSLGTSVLQVITTDTDAGDDGVVRYSMAADNTFLLEETTGWLVLKSALDRESTSSYFLQVTATDQPANPSIALSAEVNVTIIITDVNDNAPVFFPSTYQLTLSENDAVGTFVSWPNAFDSDTGINGNLYYAITGGNTNTDFSIDQLGFITTARALDYETTTSYSLTVTATDQGSTPLSATAQVGITITPYNEFDPTFGQASYNIAIDEDTAIGISIGQVTATDADYGSDGLPDDVTYSFAATSTKFYIDEYTGDIRVKGALDKESQDTYTLTVVATDSGTTPALRSNSVTLTITVGDTNDNAPVFSPAAYTAEVPENATVGYNVVTIVASDSDLGVGGTFDYNIVAGNAPDNIFAVDSSGNLYVTSIAYLDYEATTVYTLSVTATDQGTPQLTSTARVGIQITAYNEFDPVFSNGGYYTATISEGASLGDVVIRTTASDDDDGSDGDVTYLFTSGNSNGNFAIDYVTGWITVDKELDREVTGSYVLTVTAYDGGSSPSRSTDATVIVTVDDVNDNVPTCTGYYYDRTLAESVPAGTSLLQLTCSDPDEGVNGDLTYTISSGDLYGQFHVDSTGQLTVSTGLNYENTTEYQITITVSDDGSPPLSTVVTVTMEITGVNEFQPVFTLNPYSVSINENISLATSILAVSAQDQDAGTQGEVKYYITSGNQDGAFSLDYLSGDLSTAVVLNREALDTYILTVVTTDGGTSPQRSGTSTVTVTIEDDNDNTPSCQPTYHTVTVPENTTINTVLLTVNCSDNDINENAQLTYTIVNGSDGSIAMSPSNADVYLAASLDYETTDSYYIQVEVSDNGYQSNTATVFVSVEVTEVNEAAPAFVDTSYQVSVAENETTGVVILQVNATDSDIGDDGQFTYSITGGNNAGMFEISATNGEVGIKRRLDREGTDYYVLTVTATDMGSPALSSSVYVYINVTDVNDNQPTCSAYVVNIELDEDVTVGTTLASFNCTDQDINNNADLSYSIVSGDSTSRFAMVLNQLQVQNSLDFEGDDWYYLTLAVADNGSPALSANITVSIHVNPVNEFTPVYNDSSYSTNLYENITSGTVVVVVGATDADRSDQAQGMVRYSIVSGNSGNTFSLDDETGEISVVRPLDRESTNFYNLTVRVHDNVYGGVPQLSADVQVEITVLDVDDNPPSFEPESYTVSVVEGAAVGTQLAVLTYTDADDGVNTISVLSVTSGNGTGIFALIGDTLSLLGALDYETEQQYVLTVQATDVQEPSFTDTAEVIVNVISENDNQPVFAVDNTTINVSEAAAVGTVLYDANATDSDLGEHSDLTYSIVSSSSPTFLIDSVTGIVRLGAALDRETLSSYVVNITAEDTDYYDFMLLYVFVTDVNDNTPAMSNTVYPVTVDENEPIGTVLLTVLATDPDEGNNSDITYTTRGSDASFFYLNSTTGDISSQSTLDFESRKSYYFFVRANDNGYPQLYSSWSGVQVILNDLNDNSPVFSPTSYTYTLSEDSLYPIDLLTVYASDADSGTNADITYSIASGDPNNQFQINQDGVVSLVNALDREITPLYFLSITATDGGSPPQVSTPAIAVITVEDVNDNAPTFAQASYTEFVDEDVTLYTTVSTPVATDPDDGVNSQITFSILSGNDNNKFSIDPIYGYIFTIGTFDREIQDTYNLTIQAQDGESPFYTATSVVYIRIVDINDNAPVFGQSSYQTNVNENVAVGTSVITVSASDVDNGTNGEVNYYMLDTSVPFTVDNTTGVLYTSGNLDRESVSSYTFLVYVRDQGTPQFSGETTVTVYVLDLNDNTPNFTQTSYSITIEENLAQGTSILTVSATDGDSGTNADITYSISPSSTSGVQFYNIDSSSGQISVKEANDRETLDFVQMFVVATDGGSPQLSSSVEVNVTISDVNDNAPILLQTFFSLEIRYDSSSLTNLDTLSATDVDQGINGEIQYYLLDYTSLFHVDLLSGHFRKKDNSTLLEPDFKYVMSAVARDAGSPVLTSDPPATIRVDTFRPEECLVDMVVALTYDQFLQVQDSFIAALSAVFAPGRIGVSDVTTNSGTSRRRLLQSDSVTVSVYGVANTLTDSSSGLTAAKSFMSADEILEVAQLDDSGTPSAAISGQEFLNFPVTQVARSIDNSVTTAATPFVQTPAGIAVLTISAVVGLILLILLLVCCVGFCKRRRKNKVDKVVKSKPTNPEEKDKEKAKTQPVIIANAWTDSKGTTGFKNTRLNTPVKNAKQSTPEKTTPKVPNSRERKSPTTSLTSEDRRSNSYFDGVATDTVSGRRYLYNSLTGHRKWLKPNQPSTLSPVINQ